MRTVVFQPRALNDLQTFAALDHKLVPRILRILAECARTPFDGIGKPEPLKSNLQGAWSRRVNEQDRIIYTVSDTEILVHSLKGHYGV
jgi:toxin YoeB